MGVQLGRTVRRAISAAVGRGARGHVDAVLALRAG